MMSKDGMGGPTFRSIVEVYDYDNEYRYEYADALLTERRKRMGDST